MVTGHAIHFDWEIFNVSHPGYVVLIISEQINPLVAELFCYKFDLQFLVHVSTACSTLAVSNQHPF